MNIARQEVEDTTPFEGLDTSKPVLLLDVDGVINPISLARPTSWPDFVQVRVSNYDLWLSAGMGNHLARLGTTVIWCTTWCDDGPGLARIARHMGALSPIHLCSWGGAWRWKQDMVLAALTTFPLVVWVDDDEHLNEDPDHLMKVTPDTLDGLQPEELDAVWRHVSAVLDKPQPA